MTEYNRGTVRLGKISEKNEWIRGRNYNENNGTDTCIDGKEPGRSGKDVRSSGTVADVTEPQGRLIISKLCQESNTITTSLHFKLPIYHVIHRIELAYINNSATPAKHVLHSIISRQKATYNYISEKTHLDRFLVHRDLIRLKLKYQ